MGCLLRMNIILILLALLVPKSNKVEKIHTPIGKLELAAVLRNGYYAEFGRFPSDNVLAVGWSQVALENGQGKITFNYNLGKITSPKTYQYYVQRNRFRALSDFQEGAALYWRTINRLCSRSLIYFETGNAYSAAQILYGCGYYGANPKRYGEEMVKLMSTARGIIKQL